MSAPALPGRAGVQRCRVGGVPAGELRARLDAAGVALNPFAVALLSHPGFTTRPDAMEIETVVMTVAGLGRPQGATMPVLLADAARLGLRPCVLETAPHWRLQWLDQPEGAAGHAATAGCAPPGAVTVVSLPIDDDPALPRGFYLRCIDGVPWLRGYRSDDAHVWAPQDELLFARAQPGRPSGRARHSQGA